jgi:hypothetical protein
VTFQPFVPRTSFTGASIVSSARALSAAAASPQFGLTRTQRERD